MISIELSWFINIALANVDLAIVFADELEQLRGAYPARPLELELVGDTRGRWDGLRLQQLLRNLVSNAIKYGAPDTPVRVVLTGEEADVRLEVIEQEDRPSSNLLWTKSLIRSSEARHNVTIGTTASD